MSPEQSDPPAADTSGRFVGASIVLAFILFFVAASTIAYRWMTTSEPNSVLIVNASSTLTGAEVAVKGVDDPVEYKSVIGEGDRYHLPFYLDAGVYTLRVTKNGHTLLDREIVMRSRHGLKLDLTALEPKVSTTQTTQP